ncbi:MAG: hypothetical protein OEW21_18460, partial [Betaproteobacteria bacterium]|nr:hypothetical protein [Betaproteobacteria bacterium]
ATVTSLQGQITALAQTANPETCVMCHTGSTPVARSGALHQAKYDEHYQDNVMKVVAGSIGITTNAPTNDTTILTFQLTKNGTPFDCTKLTTSESATSDFSIGSYWSQYDGATKTFPQDMSLAPTTAAQVAKAGSGTANGTRQYAGGVCTLTKTFTAAADLARVALITANTPAIVQLYGVDGILEVDRAKHMSMGKFPFAGVLKVGVVDYSSKANVSGCENCHTQPFLKHAYIYGKVLDNTGTATEFYTCKGCHYDNRTGGHQFWQLLQDAKHAKETAVTDAEKAAAKVLTDRVADINAGAALTQAEKDKYAYKAKLMNDVHMSHAMEFAFPQSMRNCVTCHDGKLDPAAGGVLADANYQAETCISCHSVDGLTSMMAAAPTTDHAAQIANLRTTNCSSCHSTAAGAAPTFTALHNGGRDEKIYASDGTRYSDTFLVTVDSASIASNVLSLSFSATGSVTVGGNTMAAATIVPTILVGLYGYDTKDFIVAAHGYDSADPATRKRNLEYVWDSTASTNPTNRFTQVSKATDGAGKTTWQLTIDLSLWADKISANVVKRAEISVLPQLRDANQLIVGLNAPSRTFNFVNNAFENYFADIVQVAKATRADGRNTGCNTCHDQLATTFHSGIRGGNIKVCRTCHEVSNAGSHLELQSRSIDSYVHAVHSFQAFDPGDINFADKFEKMEYEHHTATAFPRFGIQDCESCHKPGTYDVPNQAKSLPGVLSATDTIATWSRNIGAIPPSVAGPAIRACGSCHRSQKLNADDAAGLAILDAHFESMGYVVDASTDSTERATLWASIVDKMMAIFK